MPRVGGRLRLDALPLRQQDVHGNARHPQHALVRCHPAAEGSGRPARHHEGHVHHGAWRQHHRAHAGSGQRASRSSISWSCAIPIRRPGRCSPSARTAPICCRPAPASRWTGRAPPPTARCNGASRSSSRSSNAKNDYDIDVHACPQARLRRPDVQEHQGRERRGLGRGHPARDQPRRLVDRLLRPVARAAQGAHERTSPSSIWSRCARRRTIRTSAATITACRGRAGERRNSSTPARPSSTTPICR